MIGEVNIDLRYFMDGYTPVSVASADTERFMAEYRELCDKYGLLFGPAMTVDKLAVILLYRDTAKPMRQ